MVYARQHTRTKRSKVSDPCSAGMGAEWASKEPTPTPTTAARYCNHYYLYPITAHHCPPQLLLTTTRYHYSLAYLVAEHMRKVRREDEGGTLAPEAELGLEVAEEVAEVNVEEVALHGE